MIYVVIHQIEEGRPFADCERLGMERIRIEELKLREIAGSLHVGRNRLETLVVGVDVPLDFE